MNRIRKKNANRPGAAAAKEDTSAAKGPGTEALKAPDKTAGPTGGFTEQDIWLSLCILIWHVSPYPVVSSKTPVLQNSPYPSELFKGLIGKRRF